MQAIYAKYFTLGYLDGNINEKFGLIAIICRLVNILQSKGVETDYYKVIKQLGKNKIPDSFAKGLAVVCRDFGYGCKEFPSFGVEDKEIPNKIKEILSTWCPF